MVPRCCAEDHWEKQGGWPDRAEGWDEGGSGPLPACRVARKREKEAGRTGSCDRPQGGQAEKAPWPQPGRAGLGTLRSSGATLALGGGGTPGSLVLSGASTSSTSGSPVPAVSGELRMTASGRRGARRLGRASLQSPRSCCHPWRPGAAAAGGEAGPASHPLLPGSPWISDQQARDLLKTPKADFKHNQIARAKPSL